MKIFTSLFLLISTYSYAQISGTILEEGTSTPIIGAKIIASTGEKTLTDDQGKFQLTSTSFPYTIVTSYPSYINDTFQVLNSQFIRIQLRTEESLDTKALEDLIVVGRRTQQMEKVPISLEVLKTDLIDNKGYRDLEDAINQVPGVNTMDGQVSIRGGSGFAYGAGSRVLLLWNGLPNLTADAGDAKFNSLPLESADAVEVLKGASSVLYGSGALNGIINVREKTPTTKGQTKIKYQSGIYDQPKRETLRWSNKPLTFHMADVYHGKMLKRIGYNISANTLLAQGYRQGEQENRARIAGSIFFIPERNKAIKAGVSFNAQLQRNTNFVIWQNGDKGYQPSGGASAGDPASTLGHFRGIRANLDPYINYIDKKNNKHALKTRLLFNQNHNIYNPGQTANSLVSYADYQFIKSFNNSVVTTGATVTHNYVQAQLYGNHRSINPAIYAQLEQQIWEKLDVTIGVRMEYFEQDGKRGDTDFTIGKSTLPVYPIIRAALHYEPTKGSHLRASFGQGIRYPSVAERYTVTSIGALNIFPNAELIPETGWAAEIGYLQVIPIAKKWKGILNLAGFVNEYKNMMEFQFGIYNPPGIPVTIIPTDPNFIGNWIGFRASNNERARISGLEISFSSTGKIGQVELNSMIGYTYMQPISLNKDSAYLATLSTFVQHEDGSQTYSNTLKYRFNHLLRADIEAVYKAISLGFSVRYNSKVENIDRIFEEEIFGLQILPGLREYREKYDNGALVFDARIGYKIKDTYKISVMANNIFNAEYTARPGDIQAPRNFILQLQITF